MDMLDKQKYIFGRVFLLANRLQTAGDKALGGEITIRQWLLTIAIAQFENSQPTLGDVADFMGTSHQNVKQLAVKLIEKGYLILRKDSEDLRTTRLFLTEESYSFWRRRNEDVRRFLAELFKDLSMEETGVMYDCLNKLYKRILEMENKNY